MTRSVASVVAMLAGFGLLIAPLWPWLLRRAAEPTGSSTSLLLVLGALWLAATLPPTSAAARVREVTLAGSCALLVVAATRSGINAAQALATTVAVIASFVVVSRARLGDALAPLLLFALAIPARGDLDTFIGFPLRIVAAQIAAAVLSPSLGELGHETVLVLEGRVADVEVACSGLSTLWIGIGAALVLGALSRGGRALLHPATTTLLTTATTTLALVLMTAVRVTVLSAVALAPIELDDDMRQLIGRLVHVPLGVVALVVAVGAGVLVQHLAPAQPVAQVRASTTSLPAVAWAWLVVGVLAAFVRPAVAHEAPDIGGLDRSNDDIGASVQAVLGGERQALTTSEAALYGRHADAAIKLRLDEPAGASVLVVAATSTTPHHAPERCLASAGHVIGGSSDLVDDNGSARVVVLDGGRAVGVSFFISDALADDTTIAGLGERIGLAVRARLSGAPAPRVVFVSAIWPRAVATTVLDDDERARLASWRRLLSRALRFPASPEPR